MKLHIISSVISFFARHNDCEIHLYHCVLEIDPYVLPNSISLFENSIATLPFQVDGYLSYFQVWAVINKSFMKMLHKSFSGHVFHFSCMYFLPRGYLLYHNHQCFKFIKDFFPSWSYHFTFQTVPVALHPHQYLVWSIFFVFNHSSEFQVVMFTIFVEFFQCTLN